MYLNMANIKNVWIRRDKDFFFFVANLPQMALSQTGFEFALDSEVSDESKTKVQICEKEQIKLIHQDFLYDALKKNP